MLGLLCDKQNGRYSSSALCDYELGKAMRLARRLLDAIAVRFSEAEKRLDELRLVTAPPRLDEPIDFGHATLHASQFNPEWLSELKIEPCILFDVGAFHAEVAGFLRRSFPDATIFAFEADPRLFKVAATNAERFRERRSTSPSATTMARCPGMLRPAKALRD
jgi:hypothetical protein